MRRHLRRFSPVLEFLLVFFLLIAAIGTWIHLLEPAEISARDAVIAQRAWTNEKHQQLDPAKALTTLPLEMLQSVYATDGLVETTQPGPQTDVVEVGVFMDNNYDFDMTVPMVSSTGSLWLRWKEPLEQKLKQRQIKITDLVSFPNQTQSWDGTTTPLIEQPTRLANGDYYQRIHFDDNFYIQNLGLKRYPFQTIHSPLVIQLSDDSGAFNFSNLRLSPDRASSGIGRFIDLNGFIMRGWNLSEFRHVFDSDFGLNERVTGKPSTDLSLSEIIFSVAYTRSVRSSIWTLFQPLAIVMATVILSPSLSSKFWDIRIAIPATAILTLVFLQQGYRAELPDPPYLTFIDHIYVICYVICLLCFLLYVWAANRLQTAPEHREVETIRQIDRVDMAFQIFCGLALIVGGVISWVVSGG
ncbi:MAG: hypothetical protein VKK62_07445 [Synechococcaceae cyanobacterium]|nr:hypothetical protein [Synechococcaceae cyanobacterium]